jgi:FixJ family two-component response regulator
MREHEPTVFIVDDDDSVRRGLARLLRSAGYRVETFVSARDYLAHGDRDAAGCLVLDVRMPGQSGPELHDLLVEAGHDIPVVFITGHGDMPMAVRAMKSGADFLLKPVDALTLLNAVQQALGQAR